eukprot:TRINITY_DN12373_c1_g1_i2.p1 TRINITY_DN12373_c1_g1~~TRINITY_DN12373_c1_g1_i2.p1  ORF type:complete len:1338 (+),score=243.73 TRINITY_DN12373_c1_g1_i2:297-4016(+)
MLFVGRRATSVEEISCNLGQICSIQELSGVTEAGDLMTVQDACGGSNPLEGLPGTGIAEASDDSTYRFQVVDAGNNLLRSKPGMYRLCWCRPGFLEPDALEPSKCESEAEFLTNVGLFIAAGPALEQRFACVLGQHCAISLKGFYLTSGDTISVMQSCDSQERLQGSTHWDAPFLGPDGSAYDFGMLGLDDIPGPLELCWCPESVANGCTTYAVAGELAVQCPRGLFRAKIDETFGCRPCPRGSYCPPGDFDTPILSCPAFSTTTVQNMSDKADCLCREGYYYDASLEQCFPCAPSTFKENISNAATCDGLCPVGTTSTEGATSLQDCFCDGDTVDLDPEPSTFNCTNLSSLNESELPPYEFNASAEVFEMQASLSLPGVEADNITGEQLEDMKGDMTEVLNLDPTAERVSNVTAEDARHTQQASGSVIIVVTIVTVSESRTQSLEEVLEPTTFSARLQVLGGTNLLSNAKVESTSVMKVVVQCPDGLAFPPGQLALGQEDCHCSQGLEPNQSNKSGFTHGCKACDIGFFKREVGDLECTSCSTGKVNSGTGSVPLTTFLTGEIYHTACTCPAGLLTNNDGLAGVRCSDCPPGFYCDGRSADKCPSGFSTVPGAANRSECTCSPGFQGIAAPNGSNLSCEECPAGRLKSGLGPADCSLCAPGRFAGGVGASACERCGGDGEVPNAARSKCGPCMQGRYRLNSSTCATCPTGYIPDEGRIFCELCPEGKLAKPGDFSCEACPGIMIIYDNECSYVHLYITAGSLVLCALLAWLFYKLMARYRRHRALQAFKKYLQECKDRYDWTRLWSQKKSLLKRQTTSDGDDDLPKRSVSRTFARLKSRLPTKKSFSMRSFSNSLDESKAMGVNAIYLDKTEKAQAVDDVLAEVYQESISLGVNILYVLGHFRHKLQDLVPKLEWRIGPFGPWVLDACITRYGGTPEEPPKEWLEAPTTEPPTDPNFLQVAPLLSYGEEAPGFQKICPRDGENHCSIVDALLEQDDSGQANQFLSWVWQYSLSTVFEALAAWSNENAANVYKVMVWWCFFCNNQFRLLHDLTLKSTEELSQAFGENLRRVGKMWMLLDNPHESMYVGRIWCIFEVFVARQYDVPCRAIISPKKLERNDLENIGQLFDTCKVDVAHARASVEEDEEGIKDLIVKEFGSFEQVNLTVERQLNLVMLDTLRLQRKHSTTADELANPEMVDHADGDAMNDSLEGPVHTEEPSKAETSNPVSPASEELLPFEL